MSPYRVPARIVTPLPLGSCRMENPSPSSPSTWGLAASFMLTRPASRPTAERTPSRASMPEFASALTSVSAAVLESSG